MGRRPYSWTGPTARPVPRPRDAYSSGKFGWFSEADALLAIEYARRDHPDSERWPRSAYACDDCPAWHLTGRLKTEARPA